MKVTKKYYYIKANPKDLTNIDYNNLVRSLHLPHNLFIIDWVHNVTGKEVEEITAERFNQIINSKSYG